MVSRAGRAKWVPKEKMALWEHRGLKGPKDLLGFRVPQDKMEHRGPKVG